MEITDAFIRDNILKQIQNYNANEPTGFITEIFGDEGTGKSALAFKIIAEAQREGKGVVYFDCEHTFDSFFAETIGIDLDNLVQGSPAHILKGIELFANSKLVQMIVIDTFNAMSVDWNDIENIIKFLDSISKSTNTNIVLLDQSSDRKRTSFRSAQLHQIAQVSIYMESPKLIHKAGEVIGVILRPLILKSFRPTLYLYGSLKLDFNNGFK